MIHCGNKSSSTRNLVRFKHLTKHGNSLALVIDKGVLDLLEIDADTPLSIRTDSKWLIVSPARVLRRRKRFHAALGEGNRTYGKMQNRLAD